MYKMSKRSLAGRLSMVPLFLIVLIAEIVTGKADDWHCSIRKFRMRMEDFANKKFPIDK